MENSISPKKIPAFNGINIPRYLLWVIALMLIMAALSIEFIKSAVTVWKDSETFNHCFFVYPIVIYLVWQKRTELNYIPPQFSFSLFLLLLLSMPLWMLAYAGNIDVLGHIATCFMISLVAVSALGWRIAIVLIFPLFFAFFSVPIGEELIPLFQKITADYAVKLLLLSGVPIYFEGLFIQIPEGKFLVAEACSGVRFFVSTVMLGFLYSYILFVSWKRRVVYVLFAIFLPIVANILRVYGTIMIGHKIDMQYAAGADHLIYGWYFFAVITILLISIGLYFREEESHKSGEIFKKATSADWYQVPKVIHGLLFMSFFALFFYWKQAIDDSYLDARPITTESLVSKFSSAPTQRYWQPSFKGFSQSLSLIDESSLRPINLDLFYYDGSNTEGELISWYNRIYDPDKWTLSSSKKEILSLNETKLNVAITNIVSTRGVSRTIIYWYRLGNNNSVNSVYVKLRRAFNIMFNGDGSGAFISISTENSDVEQSELVLKEWLKDNYSEINSVY